jgi:putative DNA primase/helicase
MTITPDEDLMLFNVSNGKLSLSRIHVPDESLPADVDGSDLVYSSVKFFPGPTDDARQRAAVDYDPAATCPSWNMFLLSVQPDENVRRFLQVFTAYALLIEGNPEQKLLFHFGSGANGKSVFLETIIGLAGGYGWSAEPDTFVGAKRGHHVTPDLARLADSRVVVIEELPRDSLLKADLIKTLTSSTPMLARRLHEAEPFEFRPMWTAMLSASEQPWIDSADYDVWRRVLMLHWTTIVPAEYRVPLDTLLKTFEAERSGILNWLIAGIKLYLEHGIKAPVETADPTANLHIARNNVGDFVDDFLINEPGATIQAGALYLDYVNWCERTGLTPLKPVRFGDALKRLGVKRIRGKFLSYEGLARKAADEPDAVIDFLLEVRAEVDRARAKFPGDNLTTIALFEEAGEVAKAVLQENPEKLRKEAIQLACMALRVVLDGDVSTTAYRARLGLGPLVEN